MSAQDDASSVDEMVEPEKPWRFAQWFKKMPVEDSMPDSDLLSVVEFDSTGTYLASGDRGGRVVVLRADEKPDRKGKIHYTFHCEFQSHESEFDYVRSVAIEERISKIKFLPQTNDSVFMLTTNDRAIKMFKLQERDVKYTSGFNMSNQKGEPRAPRRVKSLRFPTSETVERVVTPFCKREFSPEIHKFNIHSLMPSVDGSTFISADNLCVNLWDMNSMNVAFQVINLKPADMTKLNQYMTTADLDQETSNNLVYGTNRGIVRLCDMREKALCDSSSLEFTDPALESLDRQTGQSGASGGLPPRPFLADMLRNISDVKFAPDNLIVARDFMTLKIWDMRHQSQPVEIIPVHDYLTPRLWDLYESDYLYDSFDVSICGPHILTGSYNSYFHIYDLDRRVDTLIEASKSPFPSMPIMQANEGSFRDSISRKSLRAKKRISKPGLSALLGRKKKRDGRTYASTDASGSSLHIDPQSINYDKRITQLAWHPDGNAVAVQVELDRLRERVKALCKKVRANDASSKQAQAQAQAANNEMEILEELLKQAKVAKLEALEYNAHSKAELVDEMKRLHGILLEAKLESDEKDRRVEELLLRNEKLQTRNEILSTKLELQQNRYTNLLAEATQKHFDEVQNLRALLSSQKQEVKTSKTPPSAVSLPESKMANEATPHLEECKEPEIEVVTSDAQECKVPEQDEEYDLLDQENKAVE
ncbi:Serine/threonine-protein phosphatase 2A 55 kDa regulatory subunit B beta isoform [Hondaea fermentalgiana]|uniref:Serine/threonine-protein phosphatase 2A 55 kDa regulatory subunit B beta isoform n=1 Tax=Hondaea fermentalgiana TaxID=2315210 RepID=A0A2R5G6N4_9STRA|nr:Serine/threonine-protein phosphatase 2A 55 kDa regulatory subunit B beta isoform [Hondaea fermentalgiana]|eukprot:GBG26706.1 Serine/threonine-protein phosphatase 2A 55 kDa regulatory subunit B beta isoform [Hondaea fermentalgiana]